MIFTGYKFLEKLEIRKLGDGAESITWDILYPLWVMLRACTSAADGILTKLLILPVFLRKLNLGELRRDGSPCQ